MLTAQEKGDLLEVAVSMIERHLLTVEGNVKGSDVNIETKKILVHHGVHHEIDVYITIQGARGYNGIFVFECKNWKARVDKNEIMIFSQKIEIASAQRGFFVAPDFTADARAQAALDPRLELVNVTAQELAQAMTLWDFHYLVVQARTTEVKFGQAGLSEEDTKAHKPIDYETAILRLNGVDANFKEWADAWCHEAMDRRTASWGTPTQSAGDYPLEAEDRRAFGPGEVIVNGVEMESATVHVEFTATIQRPLIRVRVDVEGRGTAIQLEPAKIGDSELGMWITGSKPK